MPTPEYLPPTSVAVSFSVAAVTPSDSTLVGCRSLYVGGTGDVAITAHDGTSATFSAVPAGTILPVYCTTVKSTGTTATLIIALY